MTLTHQIAPSKQTFQEILLKLSETIPDYLLKYLPKKEEKTNKTLYLPYIPWYNANKVLDQYAPGWMWEIKHLFTDKDRLYLVGRLTIPAAEGVIYREATGSEYLATPAGDPTSNAESMAFRRASAKFGLGLYLYSNKVTDNEANHTSAGTTGSQTDPKRSDLQSN